MKRFDTCFFERYAQITLETVLGEEFADLVNKDRPDLQKPDRSLGIEVTRAMESSKEVAKELLKEIKLHGGLITVSSDCHNKEHLDANFTDAFKLAKECGFDEIMIFNGKEFVPEKIVTD